MNRYAALLLTLLMAVLCILPASFAEETAEDQVLATTADGVQIMQSSVDEVVSQIISYYESYGYNMSAEDTLPIVRQMAMETVLQEAFYNATSARLGLDQLTDEQSAELAQNISDVYEGLISQVYSYYGIGPAADASDEDKAAARDSAVAILDAMGYTYDYIALNETESYRYDLVTEALTADLTVSEEDILASYNAKLEDDRELYGSDPGLYETNKSYYGAEPYFIPEGFRGITHILLSVDDALLDTYQDLQSRFEESAEPVEDALTTEPEAEDTAETEETEDEAVEEPVTEEQVEAARQAVIASVQDTIDEIMTKLAEGTPWADLVAEYSTDPGMSQEPYKTNGYEVFADSTVYDPAFVQAAFSIDNVGDVSAPYVGMYGIYIVHYTRDVPAGPVELTEELRHTLEDELLSEARNEALEAAYHAWEEAADIQYTEAGEAYRPEVQDTADEDTALGE